MPLRPPEMKRLIDQLVQSGAVTVNMHQGANINPYINYVTVRAHALPLPSSSCFWLRCVHSRIHMHGRRRNWYSHYLSIRA